MLGDFLQKALDFIWDFITGIFSTIMSPITNAIDNIALEMPQIQGYREFLGGCIETFVPYRAVIICLALLAPVYICNLTAAVIITIKGWIPTLGGN